MRALNVGETGGVRVVGAVTVNADAVGRGVAASTTGDAVIGAVVDSDVAGDVRLVLTSSGGADTSRGLSVSDVFEPDVVIAVWVPPLA